MVFRSAWNLTKRKSWQSAEYVEDFELSQKGNMQKKTEKFSSLFGLSKTETVIKSFPCFLVAEILIQGTMFISDRYVCFNSNIPGLRRTIKIDMLEVTNITKEKVYAIFPTGIGVRTCTDKFVFSHVTSRDKLYHFLMSLWKNVPDNSNTSASGSSQDDAEAFANGLSTRNQLVPSRSAPNFNSTETASMTGKEEDADSGVNFSRASVSGTTDESACTSTGSSIATTPIQEASPQIKDSNNNTYEVKFKFTSSLRNAFLNFTQAPIKLIVISLLLLLINSLVIGHLSTRMYNIHVQLHSLTDAGTQKSEPSLDLTATKTMLNNHIDTLVESLQGIQSHLSQIKQALNPMIKQR